MLQVYAYDPFSTEIAFFYKVVTLINESNMLLNIFTTDF